MPGRVGEGDDPRVRCERGHPARHVQRHGHGAQPVGDPAGAGRLLAEHAEIQGHPLVDGAPGETVDADGGEDEPGPGQRVVEVGGGAHRRARTGRQHGAHRGEAARVDVVQDDLRDPAVAGQRAVDEGDAEPAAAQDRELHARRTSRKRARVAGSAPSFVTRTSTASGPQTGSSPVPGNFAPVGQHHRLLGGRDHRLLHRYLHQCRVHHPAVGADAAGAEEEPVRAHLAERLLGEHPDEREVVAAQDPAQHEQLDAVGVAQRVDHGEARRDHRDPPVAQVAGQPRGGGADVEQQHVAVPDEAGRAPGDAVLVVRGHLRDLGEGGVVTGDRRP